MSPLLVLAGGFGTRLRSVVADVPKPLAPINRIPFLRLLIRNWLHEGVRDFIFLLHYEADKIENLLNEMDEFEKFSARYKVIIEKNPLGTGGSVANAIREANITEGFMVANADTWLDYGIRDLADAGHYSILGVKVPDCRRYGKLQVENDIVVSFKEKDSGEQSGWINAGAYHLHPEIFAELHGQKEQCFSIEHVVLPKCIDRFALRLVRVHAGFTDIGVPEDYLKFCDRFHEEKNEI